MKNKEGKSFERELPKGYKIALTINAKDKKTAIIFNLVSILVLIVVVAIAFVPFIFDFDRLIASEYTYTLPIWLFVLMIVYIFLHELIHGIAYKIQTGEKLTFGMSVSCAFCGVPKIFTYRKTALIAVLAPTVIISGVLLPALVVCYFINAYTYLLLAFIFGMHLGGCCCDIYIAYLLLEKYKDDRTLMNDTGPKMTLFVYDETIGDTYDEATVNFINEFNFVNSEEHNNEMKNKSKENGALVASIVCIVFFILGALLFAMILYTKYANLLLYEKPLPLFKLMSFYLTLICIIGIIYSAITLRKHMAFKCLLAVIMVIFAMPAILLSGTQGGDVSQTTDIDNYGVYDYPEYMPDYFPKTITNEMTPVTYSYYFDYSWDWCYELYLETEMTDGEYEKYKSQYSDKLVECWYDSSYLEYVMRDEPNLRRNDDGDYYMSCPTIKKIIFNDETKTVIFWAVIGSDPFYLENSAFFEKFQIDPLVYEKKTAIIEEK
ncbi:MAG: DUF3267 domain-containing protein [Clostridia bacterium]|nr:DUF3267 domain-containing protein [Clostridia bacterium]